MTYPSMVLLFAGDAIETLGSYEEVETAFMEGKDLQASVDLGSCSGTLPEGLMVNFPFM